MSSERDARWAAGNDPAPVRTKKPDTLMDDVQEVSNRVAALSRGMKYYERYGWLIAVQKNPPDIVRQRAQCPPGAGRVPHSQA